jgi:hypothetical protein
VPIPPRVARPAWRRGVFLLDAGYAVASVAYRLSGESRFPGPVHDVAAAVRRVRANADTYGRAAGGCGDRWTAAGRGRP